MSNISPEPERLTYSVPELASVLGVSEKTVRVMAAKRQLPVVRIAGRVLFMREKVRKWLELKTGNARGVEYRGGPGNQP